MRGMLSELDESSQEEGPHKASKEDTTSWTGAAESGGVTV